MARKDVTHMIERLEAFEERAGVGLEALSAFAELRDEVEGAYDITVYGELHPRTGTTLAQDVLLTLAVYDRTGRVIGTGGNIILHERFFGFETFELACYRVETGFSRFRLLSRVS